MVYIQEQEHTPGRRLLLLQPRAAAAAAAAAVMPPRTDGPCVDKSVILPDSCVRRLFVDRLPATRGIFFTAGRLQLQNGRYTKVSTRLADPGTK